MASYFLSVCLFLAGASIPPEAMMHFPPLFQISPYFRKILGLSGKFHKFSLFPKKFPKFLISPLFQKFSPCFKEIQHLFTYFTCIFPPYFDHDAFMHYPMHVLDAPGAVKRAC